MRIDNLTYSNIQTQGAQRRNWLRQHSPQHLEQSATLIHAALRDRSPAVSRSTLVLGAGACTEVPLSDLARASDEVVLADFDLAAMLHGRDELASPALRRKVHLLQCDLTGGVSANLQQLISRQPWQQLAAQATRAIFDTAASCLEQCPVPNPPEIEGLYSGEYGLVISSLVLTQLCSYPLLDLLDTIQRAAPDLLGEQERHHRYQEAGQSFRTRVIQAHLNLLHELVDMGGLAVLLSDIRGFAFNVYFQYPQAGRQRTRLLPFSESKYTRQTQEGQGEMYYGTDHDARHRRSIPLVPRATFDLVQERFSIKEEAHWEWLTDLPQNEKLGRGYEVVGYILTPK